MKIKPDIIWPDYISLKEWADNLVRDYYEYNLPIYIEGTEWEKWADKVAKTEPFSSYGIRSPLRINFVSSSADLLYNSWEDWVKDFYKVIIN